MEAVAAWDDATATMGRVVQLRQRRDSHNGHDWRDGGVVAGVAF